MNKFDVISVFFSKMGQTLASIAKIILLSKFGKISKSGIVEDIVILGNGPSLNTTISESAEFLALHKKLAVNFACNAPVFFDLRPEYYVLADPHFFASDAENVISLWSNLAKVDWQMTLFIPFKKNSSRLSELASNKNIRIERYNLTPIEGFKVSVTKFSVADLVCLVRETFSFLPSCLQ